MLYEYAHLNLFAFICVLHQYRNLSKAGPCLLLWFLIILLILQMQYILKDWQLRILYEILFENDMKWLDNLPHIVYKITRYYCLNKFGTVNIVISMTTYKYREDYGLINRHIYISILNLWWYSSSTLCTYFPHWLKFMMKYTEYKISFW